MTELRVLVKNTGFYNLGLYSIISRHNKLPDAQLSVDINYKCFRVLFNSLNFNVYQYQYILEQDTAPIYNDKLIRVMYNIVI